MIIMKRAVIWLFPITVCVVILYLSLQSKEASMEVAKLAQQIITDTVNIPVKNPDCSWFYNVAKLRKLAHVPEYFLLGVAVSLSWVMYTDRIRNVLFRSVFMCFTVSLLDQLVKRFIAGREFDVSDMAFDNVGYVMGIIILCISGKIIKDKLDK